jgi:heme oxygenase
MPTSGTMLARLDRETGAHHAPAESGWRHVLEASELTREDYVRQLSITYGFEAPYEAACAYTPGLTQVIDLRGRWRSGLIAQDLLAVGWTPDQITSVKLCATPTFQDAAEALGWMYVVERSTLIHLAVRDELASRFVDLGRACAYLAAYETTVNRRWAELGVALDRFSGAERVADRVIGAALNAFVALREWQSSRQQGLRSVG